MFQSFHFSQNHFNQEHWVDAGSGLFLFVIDGVGRLDMLAPSTLEVEQYMNNRSTASFELVGIGGYKPAIGEEVIIEHSPCLGVPFKRIFAGHIRDISSGNKFCGRTVRHSVTCVDYNALLDKRLVFNIYERMPVSELITLIHRDFLDGERITLNGVDTKNVYLEKAVFSYVKASKAFNDIATNTGLYWYIDYYRDLKFFLRSKFSTGAKLSPNCDDATNNSDEFCAWIQSETCNKGISSANISVHWRSDQLVNKQYVIAGNDETDLRSERFVGDDERQTFSLKFSISTLKKNPDGSIASDAIQVDFGAGFIDQTVGYRDDDQSGFDWYWEKGERVIVQDDAGTPLLTTDVLKVDYRGLFKVVVPSNSSIGEDAISKYAERENTSGIYEDVADDESIESRAYAQQMANGLVRRFARVPITIKYLSDTQDLEVGQVISVKLTDHNLDMPNGFIVNAIGIQDIDGKIKRFNYELISSENLGDWQEYFRKIEYFGRQLKLREQQKVIIADGKSEGILVSQTFTSDLGSATLDTQDQEYERCYCHTGRALHMLNLHCVPEVVRLGLV